MQIPVREITYFKLKQTLHLVFYSADIHLHFLLLCVFLWKSRLRSNMSKCLQNLPNLIITKGILMKTDVISSLEIYKIVLNFFFKSEVTLKKS